MAILDSVKTGLGITGAYQDALLNQYIADIKYYLLDAGVDNATVESEAATGIITRGVADLWNYGAGEGKLSDYFMQRAIQLKINAIAAAAESGE